MFRVWLADGSQLLSKHLCYGVVCTKMDGASCAGGFWGWLYDSGSEFREFGSTCGGLRVALLGRCGGAFSFQVDSAI